MLQVTFTATGPVGAGGACVAWMGDRTHEHWSLNLTKDEYSCYSEMGWEEDEKHWPQRHRLR